MFNVTAFRTTDVISGDPSFYSDKSPNFTFYSESITDPVIPNSDQHPLRSDALQLLADCHWSIVGKVEHNVCALAPALVKLATTM
jgi:hypothetical protein